MVDIVAPQYVGQLQEGVDFYQCLGAFLLFHVVDRLRINMLPRELGKSYVKHRYICIEA